MNPETRILIQLAGAGFFLGVTIAEATGLKAPTFGPAWGWMIYAACCLTLVFEAWRTWRKSQTETNESQ